MVTKLRKRLPSNSRLARLTLVLLGTALALGLLEVGLRVFFAQTHRRIQDYQPSFIFGPQGQDRARFTSHPFLPYAPRPFDSRKMFPFRAQIQKTVECDYTNNSLGFRTPERPFEKPASVRRIVTLGGSTTFDGPTNSQTWPALLETKLNDYYANTGLRVEVINLGVDMAGSPMSLIDLEFIGLEYQPDLIISYDGVNDAHMLGLNGLSPDYRTVMQDYDESRRTIQSLLPWWSLKSYLVTVASHKSDLLLNRRMDVHGQVFFDKESKLKPADNPLEGIQYFKRNLRLMRAASREYNARFLAATAHWTKPTEKVVAMNANLREFFTAQRIDYLDLDSKLPHDDWTIHVDEVHWTLKGLNLVAEEWKEKIVSSDALGFNSQTMARPN